MEVCNTTLLRKFWLKRSTRRLMAELGFRQVGYELLEFRNNKEDRNAVESCLKIFDLLTGKKRFIITLVEGSAQYATD